jgi:hypothetical protein
MKHMNKTFTTLLSLSISLFSFAQTQVTNAGFENWEVQVHLQSQHHGIRTKQELA